MPSNLCQAVKEISLVTVGLSLGWAYTKQEWEPLIAVAAAITAYLGALRSVRSKAPQLPAFAPHFLSLNEVMLRAKTSLTISGHTLDKFTRVEGAEVRAALESLFKRNVKVTCILVLHYL